MGYFDEDIFSQSKLICNCRVLRRNVVVEQILAHAGALCLPVEPKSPGTMVEMIPADNHVNGRVHLNTANLSACKVLLVIYVVDMIVLNDREHTTQVSDDAGLSTVMDVAAAYDVRADVLLRPAFPLGLADGVTFRLYII